MYLEEIISSMYQWACDICILQINIKTAHKHYYFEKSL